MNLIEILTSIWNYILELPQNVANFFAGIQSILQFTGNIAQNILGGIDGIFQGVNGGLTLSTNLSLMFVAITAVFTIGIAFIVIDIIRDII